MNKSLIARGDSLVDKTPYCLLIELSNSEAVIVHGVETGTGFSLLEFAQQLHCKNAAVSDFEFTFLYAGGTSPTLVPTENAKTEDRGDWALDSFPNINVRGCKECAYRVVLLIGLCAF